MAKTIILSRTDSIGDVVLTLPMAGAIKNSLSDTKILFLAKDYVRPVVESSSYIDEFISWDKLQSYTHSKQINLLKNYAADTIIHVFPDKVIARLAKKAGIGMRIGTSHRTYHWLNCNYRLSIGRKNSDLHESQLNLKLLSPLHMKSEYTLSEIHELYGLNNIPALPPEIKVSLSDHRPNVILHPKSKGSAREWGLDNFNKLIEQINEKANILVTGTAADGILMSDFLQKNKARIHNLTGQLNLGQLISLINVSQCLVAASTGPLHIAAALGIKAIGLYAPMRPIHPGRWGPVGEQASFLVIDKQCELCRSSNDCECIRSITPQMVYELIFPK